MNNSSLYRIVKSNSKNFTIPASQLSGKQTMYFFIIYEALVSDKRILGDEPSVSSGTKTKMLHIKDSDSDQYTFDVYKVTGFSTSTNFIITLNSRTNDGTFMGCAVLH